MNPPNAILHELLNLAEIMLTNGAEVSRVEETLNRMGHVSLIYTMPAGFPDIFYTLHAHTQGL